MKENKSHSCRFSIKLRHGNSNANIKLKGNRIRTPIGFYRASSLASVPGNARSRTEIPISQETSQSQANLETVDHPAGYQ